MEDVPTCGKGLAEHSVLPAKLADLAAALALNLEVHQRTLDLSDENSRREYDAYVKLAREHRDISARLAEVARHMAGYRDLPMGKHDERALAGPQVLEAFATFARVERELLELLEAALRRDETMLAAIGGAGQRQ